MFSSTKRLITLTAAMLTLATHSVGAMEWTVDHSKSRLGFEVAQGDSVLTGTFENWSAKIILDPTSLETARIDAEIMTGSAITGNQQFDSMLPTPQWFDAAVFPVATFKSEAVRSLGGNQYEADGLLTIRSLSKPVTLAFELDVDGKTASARAHAIVDRSDFKVGDGIGESSVANTVSINTLIEANINN